MSRQTILTVESYGDSATRNMLKNLYETDEFRDFEIHHCFIVEAQNADNLYEILSQAITEYRASVLLIHTGREFYRLSDIFSDAILKLKSRFSGLRIGIQNRERQNDNILRAISTEQYVKDLESKFFQISR